MKAVQPLRPALSCFLLVAGLVVLAATRGSAQEAGAAAEPLAPIEDLQGGLHLSADDVVAILSARSLMLTPIEVSRIEEAKQAARDAALEYGTFAALTEGSDRSAVLPLGDLQLGAILYFSQASWTFWLNGEAVTPQSVPPGVQVLRVAPARVELAWTPDANRPDQVRRLALAPGQTYLVASGQVVESAEVRTETPGTDAPADGEGGAAIPEGSAAEAAAGAAQTNAAPGDLALSPDQVDRLSELQQALSIVSGNAAAVGMTEDELQQLQSSLAASGDAGSLTPAQQEQLNRIQQATGAAQ